MGYESITSRHLAQKRLLAALLGGVSWAERMLDDGTTHAVFIEPLAPVAAGTAGTAGTAGRADSKQRTANSGQQTADGGRRTARLSERGNIAQPSKSRPSPQSGLQPSAKPIKNAKQRILEYRQALPSTAKPQATSIIHAKSPER
ncbi:hypothetical protein PABG_11841 [Paracoccidioides brasiliensis Pb03]|nr:hypothetical protein PABG_11841 [Paracoccidioides brasiliensis Pb03]